MITNHNHSLLFLFLVLFSSVKPINQSINQSVNLPSFLSAASLFHFPSLPFPSLLFFYLLSLSLFFLLFSSHFILFYSILFLTFHVLLPVCHSDNLGCLDTVPSSCLNFNFNFNFNLRLLLLLVNPFHSFLPFSRLSSLLMLHSSRTCGRWRRVTRAYRSHLHQSLL